MKKQILIMATGFVTLGAMVFTSCNSGGENKAEAKEVVAEAKDSKGMLLSELDKFFAKFNGGLNIGVDMAKVKEIDTEVKDFLVDGKPCGNFNFDGKNDLIEWERFYGKGAPDSKELYELRFWAVDNTLETEAGIKNIDLNPIAEKINALTKVNYTKGKPGEPDENSFYWAANGYVCWMEPGTENSFTVHIRKELP